MARHKSDWEAITLCNFGDPTRREIIARHYSILAALNQYKKIEKIYGRNSFRCWQETKEGAIINDNDSNYTR